MIDPVTHWLNKLRKLHPYRSKTKGTAPHKPCLLLAVLDLAQDGELTGPSLMRSPSLQVRFHALSSIVLPRWGGKVDLALPFYHLSTQRFWQARTRDGNPAGSPEQTQVIDIDPIFFALVQDADFRRQARMVLVDSYFPANEKLALYALLGVRPQAREFQEELHRLDEQAAVYAVRQGRSARFGVQVVCGYQHTCALTGYRIVTQTGESVVEAAHIEPWAKTRNDDVRNGLALSRNSHWAFDRGLWSVDDELRVLIKSERFQEAGPEVFWLTRCHRQKLQFAAHAHLRPGQEYLQRHRQQWGF
jgi:putative restriction endonuclease